MNPQPETHDQRMDRRHADHNAETVSEFLVLFSSRNIDPGKWQPRRVGRAECDSQAAPPMHHAERASTTSSGLPLPQESDKELLWPEVTRLVYTSRHKVNKSPQNLVIQQVLDNVIEEFVIDMAFEKAILKANERFLRQRDITVEIARSLDAPEIAERLLQDQKYARTLIYVVCTMCCCIISDNDYMYPGRKSSYDHTR